MNDKLLASYEGELAHLRNAGAEFAAKYPGVAGRLQLEADRCEDPHVERFMEGVAFIAARLRLKLDDEYPEVVDAAARAALPPLPAARAVDDDRPIPGRPGQTLPATGLRIERGRSWSRRRVASEPRRFQTAYPVTLWPIEPAGRPRGQPLVRPRPAPGATALLRLVLRGTGGTIPCPTPDRLRFHLDGEGPVTSRCTSLLLNDTLQVVALRRREDGTTETIALPASALEPARVRPRRGDGPVFRPLVPRLPPAPGVLRLPGEVPVRRPGRPGPACGREVGNEVELLFYLARPPRRELAVGPDNFRLGCTPIVNLFPQVAEPIRLTHRRTEYRVVPDVARPLATEVYSIDEVTGIGSYLEGRSATSRSTRPGPRSATNAACWHAMRGPRAARVTTAPRST
ncbi:MAG: type VI secretion system baseplate subunit TssF [Singulisphaera sp.]